VSAEIDETNVCLWKVGNRRVADMRVRHNCCQILFRVAKDYEKPVCGYISNLGVEGYQVEKSEDGDNWLYIFSKKQDFYNECENFKHRVTQYWLPWSEMIPASQ